MQSKKIGRIHMESFIGKSVSRVDSIEKVTGNAKFTSDELKLPGMLFGGLLHSSHAHANIVSVNISKAKRVPGVKVVVTGRDIPDVRFGMCVADRFLLARERVKFSGEPVAAVAAESRDSLEEALELIDVKYEELPAVFDPEEAMQIGCRVVIHPDLNLYERLLFPHLGEGLKGANVHTHHKIRKGDINAGFNRCDHVFDRKYSTSRMIHSQLEPYNSLAYTDSDGKLIIWSSVHQLFSATKPMICKLFKMPQNKVKVKARYVGGNFGAQPQAERFAAFLALKTGKPVRIDYSREQCFQDGLNRYSSVVYVKDGVMADGTLVAREMKVICNGGAYTNYVPLTIKNGSFGLSTYRIPHLKYDAYGVYTNEPPSGPLRGFGVPQILWALEQQMDIIAHELGKDPVEVRKRNFIKEGETNVRGELTHSIAVEECLETASKWIGWNEKSEDSNNHIKKGKGIAVGNKYSINWAPSSANLKVHPNGTIEVNHGAEEVGQGANTVLSQIAAEEFKVSMNKIKVVWGDTDESPFDFGTVSSRITFNAGNAVRLACDDAKRQLFEIAAPILKVQPDELVIKDGIIHSRDFPAKSIDLMDLFSSYEKPKEIVGKGSFHKPGTEEDPATGQGESLTAFYTYGAQAAIVSVDIETGAVRVEKFCSVFDMGKPINPKLCEAQMEGGAAMGIGSALYESVAMENGQILNANLHDYKIPSISDIPVLNMGSLIEVAPQRDGPYGAKGLAEGTMTPTAPAIANAIQDAIGVRITNLPITPEKILAALKKRAQNV
jgi:carbon-monoxide dehydrogenase large subunit